MIKERYYADTSIWIDIYEDRKGYNDEPLGNYALKLLMFLLSKNKTIVISDILISEFEEFYSMDEIKGMIKPFEKVIEKVISSESQVAEARKISQERLIPFGDTLHAILSRDLKLILIARDNHFRKLKDISKYYKPEDII